MIFRAHGISSIAIEQGNDYSNNEDRTFYRLTSIFVDMSCAFGENIVGQSFSNYTCHDVNSLSSLFELHKFLYQNTLKFLKFKVKWSLISRNLLIHLHIICGNSSHHLVRHSYSDYMPRYQSFTKTVSSMGHRVKFHCDCCCFAVC